MIRRKLSSGVLRASKSSGSLRSTAIAHAHAAPVAHTQTAGLASATLLSSQRNWGKETVVTLKSELKKRGLSQAGTKAVLVDRIKSAEISAMLPPMPSVPTPTSAQSSSSFTRQLSTSASASAAKKRSRSSSQPTPPASEETATTDEPVTSTGPEIASQRTEAPKTEPLSPEELSVAPGLPETKATESSKSSSFGVEIPTPKDPEETEQIIPVEPDNFRAETKETTEPTSTTPKVVTVASAATHHGGGPTHAIHESTDPHSIETKEEDTSVDLSGLTSALSSAFGAPGRALKSSGISGSLPSIGAAQGFEKPQGEYKPNDRPLSGEEKTGVWIFGGIVGLSLLLGGGKKKKDKSLAAEAAAKLKGAAGGVKGDEKWAQASGAGIVGHGARKD